MSHYETIQMEDFVFSSISAVRATAQALGRPLLKNGICRGYKNQKRKCDYIIPLFGEYDIGFDKQPDGTYALVADFFSHHISDYLSTPELLEQAEILAREYSQAGNNEKAELIRKIGKVGMFVQTYQIKFMEEQALLQGFSFSQEVLEDGSINVILEKPEGDQIARVDATVSPLGKLNVEASGFAGTSCKEATEFLQKLGDSTETELKPEYFEPSETVRIRE